MATFLSQSPPQPGEGRWLTQTINQNIRSGKQRGEHDSVNYSFLPQNVASCYDVDAAEPFGRSSGSFLKREGTIDRTDKAHETSHNTFLAPSAGPTSHAYDTPEFTSFLHHPTPLHRQPSYTTTPVPDDHTQDNSMAPRITIPPHARSKHDSASESRSTSGKIPPEALQEKLNAMGVKVGSPKRVSLSPTTTFDDLLPSREGISTQPMQDSEKLDRNDSARGRARGGGRGRGRGRVILGHLNDSFVSAQSNGDAFARNVNEGNMQASRRGGWPNRKDFPQPDPKRDQTNWEKRSWDSTTIESGRASSGWETRQKKKDARQAGVPLTGYDGKFAPPPVDWDSRPGFRDGQSYDQIMQWMACIESLLCGINRCVYTEDVTTEQGITYVFCMPDSTQNDTVKQMGEIVPAHWVPLTLGRKAPETFWADIMASDAPRPCDLDDLKEARPWWDKRVEGKHFLADPDILPELGVDPDEEDAEQRLRRKHDMGSLTHAESRRALELERKNIKLAKQKKAAAKQDRLAAVTDNLDHLRIKTGVKLFVRAARKEDMQAITEIYNYYISNTTSTPEIDRRTKDQMTERWKDIRLNRMPYLVACERGGIIKARPNNKKNKRNMRAADEDIVLPDTVLGFAFADDYNDLKGMYRFTAEMEVYVRNDFYMKGVGKCLLDKLMGLLDGHYLERGGYEVVGEDIDGTGQMRVVKNIVMHLSYDKPEKLEWVGKWLEEWLQFRRVGVLDGIGTKNGKAVSMAIFQRETGEPLDHANPPIGMEYPTTMA